MKKDPQIIAPFGTVEDIQKSMRKPRRHKRELHVQSPASNPVRPTGEQTRAVRLCAEATRAVMAYADHYQVSFRRATEALILSLPLMDLTPTKRRKGGRE